MTTSNHTSLYRKYRPSSFAEVSGQDHVVKVLESAIANNKPHHAYLFTGSRGIGKTSIARIFAKALGVEQEDIYEIDAASYTGVDNIRELTESAMTLPFRSPYKIIILDEVHMLSKAAFNAFLKGLEEPPKHVIYILATTELNKIPETILSRCEIHMIKTPTVDILSAVVESVAKEEGITLSKDVARVIAMSGDGSFRDTLGALQKVIDGSDSVKIELADVENILGIPKTDLVEDILALALESKPVSKVIDTLRKNNTDSKIVYDMYVEKLRERLRDEQINPGTRDKVLILLTKALEEYRHLRFVDPLMMLEVVAG